MSRLECLCEDVGFGRRNTLLDASIFKCVCFDAVRGDPIAKVVVVGGGWPRPGWLLMALRGGRDGNTGGAGEIDFNLQLILMINQMLDLWANPNNREC